MSAGVVADPGSFRDPLSRVFLQDDDVFRGFRGRGVDDLGLMERSGFLDLAMSGGRVIGTERVNPQVLPDEWEGAVRHERLPFISYPYEWSFSMLRDAALLQLELSLDALEHGLITKDATPFNVQFRGSVPVFIDIGSFERLEPGTPWFGYRQFCEQFFNPLVLQSVRGVRFQPWLRGSQRGIGVEEMAALLSVRDLFRRGIRTHVSLHAWAERRNRRSQRDLQGELRRAGFGPGIIAAQLRNLRKAVDRLRWDTDESIWSGYSSRDHYSDADLATKEAFVDEVVGLEPRRMVWDLGANDGRFSRIAARGSEVVIAVDSDDVVVDRLYRQLAVAGDRKIIPIVMDLIDSSPSQGWMGREHRSFLSRSAPDVVLALALVHHLALPGNVPIVEIVDWLGSTGAEVIVEVPHRNDPLVQRLLRAKRADVVEGYQLDAFDDALTRVLDVRRREELPSGTRTLYHAVPRT